MVEKSFEKRMERLEEIVRLLENGEVSLDESIKLYKEGTELSKLCHDELEKAKQTVEKIALPDQTGE